jgi:carnitine 3-dehydrogenase
MSYGKPIRRIAVVGTGVIGASWAAEYLARGFDVTATDPAPGAETNLRELVDEAWRDLTGIGLSKGASRDRLSFTTNMKEALSQADFVQENGPERPDFKMKLYAEMDEVVPVDSISCFELIGNHAKCHSVAMQAPGAGGHRTSVQSTAYHTVSRSRRR